MLTGPLIIKLFIKTLLDAGSKTFLYIYYMVNFDEILQLTLETTGKIMLTGPLIVNLIDTKSQTFLYIHCKVGYQPKRYIKGFKELVQIRNMVLTLCF